MSVHGAPVPLSHEREPRHRFRTVAKRGMDIVCTAIGMLLTAPAWVLVPLAIILEDGGPVFYAQTRVGRSGRSFRIWKFRSMRPRPECGGPLLRAELETSRITVVGRFLRASGLDELPQLWSILRGDMSMVGPRALLPEEVVSRGSAPVKLSDTPGYVERHSMRPGLTGLAQVCTARDAAHRIKFRYDLLYIRHGTVALDVRLIAYSVLTSLRVAWSDTSRRKLLTPEFARLPLALALLLSTLVMGCSSGPGPATITAPQARPGLTPGDAVRVQIWREPDLSGDFAVDRDGVVVFPLLGERQVAGIPAGALESQLGDEYQEYLVNPAVDITILRRIAILGEVRQPGLYSVDPTVTLTEALAIAGGVNPSGDRGNIRLIRDGQVILQSLDADRVISTTPIQSGDQIEVAERGWLKRNMGYVTVAIGSITSIAVAFIVR